MTRNYWIALVALVALAGAYCVTRPSEESARRSAAVAEMAANWSGEMRFETTYDALAPGASETTNAEAGAAASEAAKGFDANDEFSGLPRNPGYQDVAAYCSACHSLQLVMQQSRSERRWNQLIDVMIRQQGMPAPPTGDRQRIAEYLARNYGEKPN